MNVCVYGNALSRVYNDKTKKCKGDLTVKKYITETYNLVWQNLRSDLYFGRKLIWYRMATFSGNILNYTNQRIPAKNTAFAKTNRRSGK